MALPNIYMDLQQPLHFERIFSLWLKETVPYIVCIVVTQVKRHEPTFGRGVGGNLPLQQLQLGGLQGVLGWFAGGVQEERGAAA